MSTHTLYILYSKLLLVLGLLAVSSCTDELVSNKHETENPLNRDKGIGELVLFSSGSTSNTNTRAVIPYMEKDGRFVCKMYYHAKATDSDTDPFDVENTPITSWLRVNDLEGNSVYWRNDFDLTGVDKGHQDYIDYGFDSRAQYFYWRNRLYHIFLAYTDFNLLKENAYELTNKINEDGDVIPKARSLFMYPNYDGAKKTKTGDRQTWDISDYKTLKLGWSNPEHTELVFQGVDKTSYPNLGLHFPLMNDEDYHDYYNGLDVSHATIVSTRNQILTIIDGTEHLTAAEKAALKDDIQRTDYSENEITAEGTFRYARWWVALDASAQDAYNADGSVNLGNGTSVVYCQHEKQKLEDIIATAPANTFDLRRGETMNSMADQPDPLIALTKMKPTGATQEANRVRLYFKHQFSQIQVNLTNAENTAEIKAGNIVSVELLGVTEKGYVFTNINPDGTQIPPSYDPVVISKYSTDELKENPYGTSFNMFDMGDSKPLTSLKSFNAIAFGQLQAIRITWKEEDTEENGVKEEGVRHVATYKITVDDRNNSLVNLRSGFRYMYDFELRRGTIAFIRATIDGWQLHDDLNYGTSGTIYNPTVTPDNGNE